MLELNYAEEVAHLNCMSGKLLLFLTFDDLLLFFLYGL